MRNLFYFKLIKFKYIEIKSFTIVCLCMCMCVCEKERKENYFLALFFGHIPSISQLTTTERFYRLNLVYLYQIMAYRLSDHMVDFVCHLVVV